MALDTITIKYLTDELKSLICEARIEKIYQPETDEIMLSLKSVNGNFKLVISANASHPRIHLASTQKQNPDKAPLFCMLLRKHLQGGRIIGICQVDNERIIRIDIDSYNELGDKTTKHLFCEIMGRHSNIILTKSDLCVIDSIKHIDFSVSSVRQILPGLSYEAPPSQNKIPILSQDFISEDFDLSQQGQLPDKAIMNTISGISPLSARELVYNAIGKNNLDCSQLSNADRDKIVNEVRSLLSYPIKPCIIYDAKSNKSIDFSPHEINQYGDFAYKKYFEDINSMLDEFYKNRDSAERMKQKSTDLIHILNTSIERVSKKLALLKKTVRDAQKKDEYKIKGDLLSTNIYKIQNGDSSVTVENFYDEQLCQITIVLNPMLTPSQNVQRYYKLYQKAKTAEVEAAKQLENAMCDLEYLESTLVLTQNAQSESDLNAIRTELGELGYMKKRTQNKKHQTASKPHHYISSDGFDIYVGKNNTQNDMLTLRFANSQDMWFHTKKIHGSHTVIKLGVNKEIPPSTIREAAGLAAYYSKARDSSNVPVDYTQIKNVKKPNGAKPGMVIYDYYNTVYVTPSVGELEKLN